MFGLPGEEQKLLVLFGTTDYPIGSRPISVPGYFRVQFLLARPGRLAFTEHEASFLTNKVGDSHLGIAKSKREEDRSEDITGLVLETFGEGWHFQFRCVVNEGGYVGKILTDNLYAHDYAEAEAIAYRALTPFLSAWSVALDIPMNIETVQVTDLTTHTDMLRIRAPCQEMRPSGGTGPELSQEFCGYASVYREAMNADSPFYRFLCFYKVVESIYFRRSAKAKEAKLRGEEPRRYNEDVPLSREAISGLLYMLYPWRTDWSDEFSIQQILPEEARGKRFKAIREHYLEPLRNGIAHGLMRSGYIETVADRIEDVNNANKWLPLLRVWTRLLLKIEFPKEFGGTGG